MLYMVCDGHSGVDAASYVAGNFIRLLCPKLPDKAPNVSHIKGKQWTAIQVQVTFPQAVQGNGVLVVLRSLGG